ncbi:16S rRNA (cytosine(967)-C(5))-methyltransferase RsmB [Natranaerofaba carboxydovora]|uniref:16S rRNA (cytosine(967)-C(5))-methyltransferase RsmB n=1 Tax=Natranaerofaba carboxydovora TaxID=2742683 RepID=UPI001F13EFE4|nr:16S rRNA (cytosine(967)-C(5))-methyltransferase RsmB [Natranaerofaba carboxydovora]UMZ73300.1 Ribosomal RNA small subunit methyltransferase B [Natranaerofaba carboxydovora]
MDNKKQNSNARYISAIVLKEVYSKEGYSDILLNKYLKQNTLSVKDKALATRCIYGVLQWQGLIDFYLEKLSKKPLNKISLEVLVLLRLGLYQLLFLDRVPSRAAVYETVKVAHMMKQKKAAGFINGILRNFIRKKDTIQLPVKDSSKKQLVKYISVRYSHPTWMVEKWLDEFGENLTIEICKANNEISDTYIRTNTLKTDKEELLGNLNEYNLPAENALYPVEAIKIDSLRGIEELALFKEGLFYIQDINSMLVSYLAAPLPGQKVVDLCSAPGGKTTHMGQMMQNKGEILAVDLYPHRLNLVKENCERLGVNIVKILEGDARTVLDESYNNYFDISLVDAPCSALGVLRKQPELKWRLNETEIDSLKSLQKELLQKAIKLVKPGGKIIYSTCTISSEENETLISEFLDENSSVRVEEPNKIIPQKALEKAYRVSEEGVLFLPNIDGGDGFFLTCLQVD